jgi:hypothetical protein
MEDVIAIYHLPYDHDYPQVFMGESCKQLIGEVHEAIACAPGRLKRLDAEYVRNGVVQIFQPEHADRIDQPERSSGSGFIIGQNTNCPVFHLLSGGSSVASNCAGYGTRI